MKPKDVPIEDILPVALSMIVEGTKYAYAMKNPNRKKIIEILNKNGSMNIRDISKKLSISYKSTYMNVQRLEKDKIVKLSKDRFASGQAVTVSLNPLPKGLSWDMIKQIKI